MRNKKVNIRKGRQRFRLFPPLILLAVALAVLFIICQGGTAPRPLMTESLPTNPNDVFSPEKTLLDIPCIDQREKYPTGCESVTAVMALNHAGVNITVEAFIDGWLPKSDPPMYDGRGGYRCADPNEFFMGDPYSEDGWGCYAPAIESAVEGVLMDKSPGLKVENHSGKTLTELFETCVCQGVPVMVWVTMDMAQPRYGGAMTVSSSGRQFDWITPEHCMLLVGADEENYYFCDPLKGCVQAYGRDESQRAYEALGRQALSVS